MQKVPTKIGTFFLKNLERIAWGFLASIFLASILSFSFQEKGCHFSKG